MNFKYYAYLYLKLGRTDWKFSTFCKNEGIVNNRLSFFFDKEIEEIKPSDVRSWLSDITDVGSKSKKNYLNCLNGVFTLALEDEAIDKNPVIHIKKLIYTAPKIEPFTNTEVLNILEEAKKYSFKFRLFIAVGFFTGMRTGEIIALKNQDVDMVNRIITINATRSRFGESSPKTIKSVRRVPILNRLYDLFWVKFGRCQNLTYEYLLETQYHEPYRDCNVFLEKCWKPILKDLGIRYRRPYTMRHTYATNMLIRNLITPPELAALMGHSSVKMIYDVYVNYLNSNLSEFKRDIEIYD